MLVAVDPGTTTGWAVFNGQGTLYHARGMSFPDCLDVFPDRVENATIILEIPQAYPHGSKGDPQDLITLAMIAGELRGLFRPREVTQVFPRAWKGNVPKAIHHPRVLAALTDAERAVLPKRPRAGGYDGNMIDAIGLGLWALGRT